MMSSHVESPNLIDVQPLKLKPYDSGTKKVTSSDDPCAGKSSDGGKRRRIDSVCESSMFPGSPVRSTEGGDSPADMPVAGKEACQQAEGMSRSTFVSHGSVSLIGRRRAMEDAIVVVPDYVPEEFSFSAVYDGHGGARVSNLCRDKMHQILLEEIKKGDKEGENMKIDWEKVMGACFKKMDDVLVGCGTAEEEEEMGSTAAVTVVGKKVVVVANCGDSRVVLSRGGDTVALSRDHKPDRPDENERVESSGGRVTTESGSLLCGVLTTSRSIGDKYLKPYVISDPEVTVTKRTEFDQFLIIASGGLWDAVSNELACDIVAKCFRCKIASENSNDASEAAAKLAELAIAKGSKDNISVIVVELNKSS